LEIPDTYHYLKNYLTIKILFNNTFVELVKEFKIIFKNSVEMHLKQGNLFMFDGAN